MPSCLFFAYNGTIELVPGGRTDTNDFPNIIDIGSSNDSLPW